MQTSYRIVVSNNSEMTDTVWESGIINSFATNQIEYNGLELKSNSRYFWKVIARDRDGIAHESEVTHFETALLSQKEWSADWIGAGAEKEPLPASGFYKSVKEQYSQKDTVKHDGRSLLLRNKFSCSGEIKKARVYVTGLGYYELYINGARIGNHVLTPGKTNYTKEVLYDSYDVTAVLKSGVNSVGIHLGNGWFNPYKKWWQDYRMQWFGAKKATMQMYVEYADGETDVITTDKSWKYHPGPVLYSCVYDGEFYDATKEIENWASNSLDDSDWKSVNIVEPPKGELRSQTMQAIKVNSIIEPVKIYRPKPGVVVYDMGQNFAGWAKVTMKGERGTKLHLQFAEEIFDDGSINVTSNENAKAEATYILRGDGTETYEPRFTFYGFRYVEMKADTELPEIKDVKGCVVYSANRLTGSFKCGNETINKIHSATLWSQKSNMMGYPMDCPQRDERLGWMGDAQVTAEEAMFNLDMPLFYRNWITGIRKNQNPQTGDIPIISPRPYIWDEGVEWSSTYINLLWRHYTCYGDADILNENYSTMKRYMQFLDSISENSIIKPGWIGDWGSLAEGWQEGEPESVPTAFYFWNSEILSKVAGVLGNESDSLYFSQKAEVIKTEYNKRFFNKKKKEYNRGSQMANAFPLYLGLVPEKYKGAVLENLINDIVVKHNGHLTTGVLGSKYMIDALTANGRADVAYLLATQTGYPSWSDMVEKYTTMCEFWTLKQSHNHVMTGSIDAFFYNTLAGIQLNEDFPGCRRITIKPFIPESLPFVKASIETVKGRVAVHWEKSNTELKLNIEIPANSEADIYIPAKDAAKIFESGTPILESRDIEFVESTDSYCHYVVKSGKYRFVIKHCKNKKRDC